MTYTHTHTFANAQRSLMSQLTMTGPCHWIGSLRYMGYLTWVQGPADSQTELLPPDSVAWVTRLWLGYECLNPNSNPQHNYNYVWLPPETQAMAFIIMSSGRHLQWEANALSLHTCFSRQIYECPLKAQEIRLQARTPSTNTVRTHIHWQIT